METNVVSFEYIFACLLIPIMYVFAYIAGKHDLLNIICKMLEEKAKELEKSMEKEDANG